MRAGRRLVVVAALVVAGTGAAFLLRSGPDGADGPRAVPVPSVGAITDTALAARIDALAHAAETSPRDANAWARLAMTYHVHELLPLAETCYARALALDPSQVRWRWFRAGTLETADRLEEALAEAARVRREASGYAPVPATVAQWLLARGRLDEALESARTATDTDPNDPGCWIVTALVYHERGDFPRGETAARRALRLPIASRSQEAYAHFVLGRCLAALGRTDEAKRELARGRSGDGRYPIVDRWKRELNDHVVAFTTLLAAAHGDLMSGGGAELVPVYADLHRRDPGHAQVSGELALALRRAGRLDESVGVLDDGLARHREQPWLLLQLALTKEAQGDTAEALRLLERGVASGSEQGELHEEMGMLLLRLGRRDEAVRSFERAVEVEPDRSWSLIHAGVAKLEAGDVVAAAGYFERCEALDPGNADVYAGLAVVAARKHDFAGADRLLDIAHRLEARATVLMQAAADEIESARRR
ncbi:MAG: tetratricopeptide repeat protein [Planctomycetes bacterium]|nr:tetratricopeptide repeat protein [Planctomycetota bacterium]